VEKRAAGGVHPGGRKRAGFSSPVVAEALAATQATGRRFFSVKEGLGADKETLPS